MTQRFIKFIPEAKADFLQEHFPNAFLLLCQIAKRARRFEGAPDGLKIGEALIGDYWTAGIETEMKYRVAKEKLIALKIILILETCRTRKKVTTGITTGGTKVKLLDSSIWDINPEVDNDRCNERVTTEQRPNNDEQERKRKNKKEEEEKKKIKKEKIKIRDWVDLTQIEIDSLFQKHGSELANQMLDILDAANTKNQKHYVSDYGALKTGGWVFEEAKKRNSSSKNGTYSQINGVDRRTKNVDGTPVQSVHDGRF